MPAPFRLDGLVAAPHTPFDAQGELAPRVIERQAEHLLAQQVRWAFVCGTTGESASLSVEERAAVAQRWLEVARGTPLQVIVHVGSNSLADARHLARLAESQGAAALGALAPSYFKPKTVPALADCLAQISAAAPGTPLYYYDIPVLTGIGLPAAELLALAPRRVPTLAGVKFTNPDLMSFQLCRAADDGRWDIAWGCDETLLAALALGATAAVGSSYNFAAPIYRQLWQSFEQGDLAAARRHQLRSVRLIALLARYGYLAASKVVMELLGVPVGPPRLPNERLSAEQAAQLRQELEQLEFFKWIE